MLILLLGIIANMGNTEGRLVEPTSVEESVVKSVPETLETKKKHMTVFECSDVKRNPNPYGCETVGVDEALKWSNKDIGQREAQGKSAFPLFNLTGQHAPASMSTGYGGAVWENIWDASYMGSHLCETMNGFVASWHLAFADHYPVSFSPDDVWMVIVNQISLHITQNPEKYRHIFVKHDGKKEIELFYSASEYHPGKKDSDWLRVVRDFTNEIKKNIGEELFNSIVADFSTTDQLREFISCVGLMDAVQHYFDFTINTMCGVPEIQMEGELNDWVQLRIKAEKLIQRFDDLGDWPDRLFSVLDKFIETADPGKSIDKEWWNSFYHYANESGGPQVNGHITNMFLYIRGYTGDLHRTKFMKPGSWSGYSPMSFPTAVSKVPILWKYPGDDGDEKRLNMFLMAGSVGCMQNPETLAVSPHLMWSLHHRI